MSALECAVCGAPAEVSWSSNSDMIDFDGEEGIVEVRRIQCAAGHWYTDTGEEVRP